DNVDHFKVILFHMGMNHAAYIAAYLTAEPSIDFSSQNGKDCVFKTIDDNYCEILQIFLKHSPGIKDCLYESEYKITWFYSINEATALMYAAWRGKFKCVKLLNVVLV
ncbi:unnamed protein product, partial [Owenia fusiformis]